MLRTLRGGVGALLGATAAAAALRLRQHARERGEGIGEVLTDAPDLLAEDARRLRGHVEAAIIDGKRAAAARQVEVDEALKGIREKVADEGGAAAAEVELGDDDVTAAGAAGDAGEKN